MVKPIVFLLSGFSRSGKDSVAGYLTKQYGFQRLALADIIKEDCANETGIPLMAFHSDDLKDTKTKTGKTPRDYCIEKGNKLASENPLYLIETIYLRMNKQVETLSKKIGNTQLKFVITDIRRSFEQRYFLEKFPETCYTFYVYRFDKPVIKNVLLEFEIMKQNCKYVIDNSGTTEETHQNIDKLIKILNLNSEE